MGKMKATLLGGTPPSEASWEQMPRRSAVLAPELQPRDMVFAHLPDPGRTALFKADEPRGRGKTQHLEYWGVVVAVVPAGHLPADHLRGHALRGGFSTVSRPASTPAC